MNVYELRRRNAADNAESTCQALTDRGIELPPPAAEALALLQRINDRRPPRNPVNSDDIAELYLSDADTQTIDAALIARHIGTAKAQGWEKARTSAGLRTLHALTQHHEPLTRELADRAAPIIGRLEHAASLATLNLEALIRNGHAADAEVAARITIDTAELNTLYTTRHTITPRTSRDDYSGSYAVNGIDCGMWRDPRTVPGSEHPCRSPEHYLDALRAGAELWFPTHPEALAAARAIDDELRPEREAQARRERMYYVSAD